MKRVPLKMTDKEQTYYLHIRRVTRYLPVLQFNNTYLARTLYYIRVANSHVPCPMSHVPYENLTRVRIENVNLL